MGNRTSSRLQRPPRDNESSSIMKLAPQTKLKAKRCDELGAEYRFDYTKSKPNRFAEPAHRGAFNPTKS